MKIHQLAITAAILACLGSNGAKIQGQTTPSSGATVTESESDANRSGISQADIGSFEATEAPKGRVGRDAEDVSATLRELRGTDRQQRNANMRVENLNERRNARRRRQAQRSPPPPVHVQLRPSFSIRRTPSVQVAKNMQTRLSRLLEKRDAGSILVALSDRTATLTGTVKSEYQRKLLERMVRIEPGVSAVENLITVQQ